MKRLSEGKSRLATEMSREQRAELVVGMLRRVIAAIRSANIGLFWVVGGRRAGNAPDPQLRRRLF